MALPFDVLERYVHLNTEDPNHSTTPHLVSNVWLATVVGCDYRTVIRWRHTNRLPASTADRIAIHLGVHPTFIWADWYQLTAPERERAYA
jgi:hypothetical protein